MKHMRPSSSLASSYHFGFWGGGWAGEECPIPAATLSRYILLTRTYEVGVTILRAWGGRRVPRAAVWRPGVCRVPAPSSTPLPEKFVRRAILAQELEWSHG